MTIAEFKAEKAIESLQMAEIQSGALKGATIAEGADFILVSTKSYDKSNKEKFVYRHPENAVHANGKQIFYLNNKAGAVKVISEVL